MVSLWHKHPAVRTGADLTRGERAADIMRNGLGSWWFVFAALGFLGGWIGLVKLGVDIDNGQLTILNLVLSCLAALQGGILLIAAKRADQVASEVAMHTLSNTTDLAGVVASNAALIATVEGLTREVHAATCKAADGA